MTRGIAFQNDVTGRENATKTGCDLGLDLQVHNWGWILNQNIQT